MVKESTIQASSTPKAMRRQDRRGVVVVVERAVMSGSLGRHVLDARARQVVTSPVVDSSEIKFPFFRWGDSNGTLIEKLGDGRIRIHVLVH
jgi:hypothetical protein